MTRDWSKIHQRDTVRRHGADDVRQRQAPFMLPLLPRRRRPPSPDKATLRAQADAAVAAFTGTVKILPPAPRAGDAPARVRRRHGGRSAP
jgi:hypothetical protein